MLFLLKTNHRTTNLYGEYVDEEEPISIYKTKPDFICPYNRPKPLMMIEPGSTVVIYLKSKHASMPNVSNYKLIGNRFTYTQFKIVNE